MNPEQFRRLEDLFERACQLPNDELADFVSEVRSDDTEIARALDELLSEDAALQSTPSHLDDRLDLSTEALIREVSQESELESIGPYRLVRSIGQGGMGMVYEAIHEGLSRRVALKLLRSDALLPKLVRRIEQEAHILAKLDHPGIARVYDASSLETPLGRQPYFAMELIEGRTLTETFEARQSTLEERIEILAQVAEAVHYAHEHGVVHRDLKPTNVLVVETSTKGQLEAETSPPLRAKILDFGIAKLSESDVRITTMRGNVFQLIGTLQYMSPEQAQGVDGEIDSRSDVYSLGVILYEALAGDLPYEVSRESMIDAIDTIRSVPPRPLRERAPEVSVALEAVVTQCLAKDPARRMASAGDLARALRDILLTGTTPSAPGTTDRSVLPSHWGILILTLAIAGLLSWLLWFR